MRDLLFWQPAIYPNIAYVAWVIFNYLPFVLLAIGFVLLFRSSRRVSFVFLLLLVTAQVIELILKSIPLWRRPFVQQGITNIPPIFVSNYYSSGSFPSGHASKLTILALFLYIYLRPNRLQKIGIGLFFLPFVLGRVILGLHYPIDIFGGLALGLVLAYIGTRVVNQIKNQH